MKDRKLWVSAVLCLTFTVLWLIFMIISMAQTGTIDSIDKAVASVNKIGPMFMLTYINAVLVTITAAVFFTCLYNVFKETDKEWSMIGIIWIPIYFVINFMVYSSQITILPRLIDLMEQSSDQEFYRILIGQLVQGWSGSAISIVNQMAYMILGIPSILFGILSARRMKKYKVFGCLLTLNGTACIVGGIGTMLNNQMISMGSLIGGILFLLALAELVRTGKYRSI